MVSSLLCFTKGLKITTHIVYICPESDPVDQLCSGLLAKLLDGLWPYMELRGEATPYVWQLQSTPVRWNQILREKTQEQKTDQGTCNYERTAM